MEAWQLAVLAGLGCLAGVLNVVAGGGSLLTLPAMVLMGMDGPVANGTNRVAILAQNVTAVWGFRSKGYADFQLSLTLALATLPGAIAGAYAGTVVRGEAFNRILAGIMIGVLILMVIQERRPSRGAEASESGSPRFGAGHVAMAAVGFYGGFIQAGVGFLLMAALHGVMRLDLVRVNMHKVFVVGVFTVAALAVFAGRGQVLWVPGLALAAGNSVGGWLGARLSVERGEGLIRKVLYVALAVMAVRLLWPA